MGTIDLNCDLGESFGAYKMGNDEEILNYVTSANIACGFHAGDPETMEQTVLLALEKGVKIGAHPGFPDLKGFGRRNMEITPREAYQMVLYQIGALQAFVTAEGGEMHHVKPHGALYNMAAMRADLAEGIAEAIYKVNPQLILYGLSGSQLVTAGEKVGLKVVHEVFADRTYQRDGSLTPRSQAYAVIHDEEQAIYQVLHMVKTGSVKAVSGETISIQADTLCLHGDGPHALSFARRIREKFREEMILVSHPL